MKPTNPAIVELVKSDDKALILGLTGLFARQTEVEQTDKTTKEKNGRGFYPRDSKFLSSAAVTAQLSGGLTDEAVKTEVRNRVTRYGRQLTEILEPQFPALKRPAPKRGRPPGSGKKKTEVVAPVAEAPAAE